MIMDPLQTSVSITDALQRAADYLLGRQTPSGGFCFYRWGGIEEPNLSDTDHALAALLLLGRSLPNPGRVAAFLDGFAPSPQPEALMHLIKIGKALGRSPLHDEMLRRCVEELPWSTPPGATSTQIEGWLRRTRLIAALRRNMDLVIDGEHLVADVNALVHGGGVGSTPNLIDTQLALEISELCGRPLRRGDVRDFVDSLQIPVLGFTSTPTSRMGRLELVASGVASCRLLALPLRHREDTLNFVLDCQAENGAFANAPGALPDIESTHSGVVLLRCLAGSA